MDNTIERFESTVAAAKTYEDIAAFLSFERPFPAYLYYHIQYFYCPGDIETTLLKSWARNAKISSINNQLVAFNFSSPKNSKPQKVTFFINSSSVPHLYMLNSLCYSFGWNTLLTDLLKNKYPRIVFFYWKQRDLSRALKILEESLQGTYKLIIKELSIKEKRDKQSNGEISPKRSFLQKYDSLREWTSKTLSQVLDEALERDQWFKKIRFQLHKYSKDVFVSESIATCNISKFGSISFNNYYHLLTSILCKELEPSYESAIKLYANRGLKERSYKPAKPIAIEYDYDVFGKDDQLATFKKLIEKFPYSSKAFYHSNPYFHASVADYKDNSSYDVFISNPKRILVIPQIRTSIEAFERFVSFIFYEFKEGIVKEMEEIWPPQ